MKLRLSAADQRGVQYTACSHAVTRSDRTDECEAVAAAEGERVMARMRTAASVVDSGIIGDAPAFKTALLCLLNDFRHRRLLHEHLILLSSPT